MDLMVSRNALYFSIPIVFTVLISLSGCSNLGPVKAENITEKSILTALKYIDEDYYDSVKVSDLYRNSLANVHAYLEENQLHIPLSIKNAYLAKKPITLKNFLPSLRVPLNDYYQQSSGEVSLEQLQLSALIGLTGNIDEYGRYIGPALVDNIDYKRKYARTGIWYRYTKDGVYVLAVNDDSPAERAGITAHSKINSINSKPTSSLSRKEVDDFMDGYVGGEITLEIVSEKGKKPESYVLPYERYVETTVIRDYSAKNIAYLHIRDFAGSTDVVKMAIEKIRKAQGRRMLHGVLLDLRDSDGTSLLDAYDVANIFLDSVRLFTLGKNVVSNNLTLNTGPGEEFRGVNMVVLINSNTRNGAEILAGALQYYGRALVVGFRSEKDGVVMKRVDLDNGHHFNIRASELLLADGHSLSVSGVTPDVCLTKEVYSGCQDEMPYSEKREMLILANANKALVKSRVGSMQDLEKNVQEAFSDM